MVLQEAPRLFMVGPQNIQTLYASQPWVNDKDIERAFRHNSGQSSYKPEHPTIYRFSAGRVKGILIGDGHHRVADALTRGLSIILDLNADLGTIDPSLLNDPHKAAQKFAIYGIEGIWPFTNFMKKFHIRQQILSGLQAS